MLARGASAVPDDAVLLLAAAPVAAHHAPPTKKRKHTSSATVTAAASPAPSDLATTPNPTDANVVLPSSSHDLLSRPRLSISRAPVLVPIADASPYHSTEQLATNHLGYRYVPAGLTPPGSLVHVRTIESAPTAARVSWEDRSPSIKVTADGLGLLGDRGFRSARLNAPVREGKWYLEVAIEHAAGARTDPSKPEGAHVRLGWGRREAPLNAPCGLDGYSYALRDKTGDKVTLSRPRPYAPALRSGDVVGLYISLPPLRAPAASDPHDPAHVRRERIAIEFKGQEYFEYLEYAQSKEMLALMDFSRKPAGDAAPLPPSAKKSATVKNVPERGPAARSPKAAPEPAPLRPLPTLPASQIAFFVNGATPGAAFRELYDYRPLRAAPADERKARKRAREGAREHKENAFDDGCLGYYPFVSLFNDARVRINPGPDFAFPPPPDIDAVLAGEDAPPAGAAQRTWRPFCERYGEFMEEQWALDREEEAQAKEALAQETAEQERRDAQRERRRLQSEARKRKREPAPAAATPTSTSTPKPGELEPEPGLEAEPEPEPEPERDGSAPAMMITDADDARVLPSSSLASSLGLLSSAAVDSPAPTASSVDIVGMQSAYNSDYGDGEREALEEEEEEEEDAVAAAAAAGPRTQQQSYYYNHTGPTQMLEDDQ